ncbi:hypothetical protein CDFC105_74196 [Clostridioides difficile]|nr:hypothetical protein CDFC105_63680 [Clostridioides difficile]CZS11661.1 hypothetical protein CDFC105_74196 [Clostridioides difficile]
MTNKHFKIENQRAILKQLNCFNIALFILCFIYYKMSKIYFLSVLHIFIIMDKRILINNLESKIRL